MNQLFTASEYAHLHSLVFRNYYPGYKPNVVESPNGDGVKDLDKRYAHVSEKYIGFGCGLNTGSYPFLNGCLDRAHNLAMEVAITIGVPREFWPVRKYGALRVLEYNAKATTAPHTDFDLFTLMCYRNLPEYFKYADPRDCNKDLSRKLQSARALNDQVHFGEIL